MANGLTLFNLKDDITPASPQWLRQVRMAAQMRANLPALRDRIFELSKALTAIAAGTPGRALTVEQVDGMTEVILDFVLLPADRLIARELILDLSCEELATTIEAITASLT